MSINDAFQWPDGNGDTSRSDHPQASHSEADRFSAIGYVDPDGEPPDLRSAGASKI